MNGAGAYVGIGVRNFYERATYRMYLHMVWPIDGQTLRSTLHILSWCYDLHGGALRISSSTDIVMQVQYMVCRHRDTCQEL